MKKLLAFVLVAGVIITLGLGGCKEKAGSEHPSSEQPAKTEEHPAAEHPE